MSQPVIGLTMNFRKSGGFSAYPWYAVRQNYCKTLADIGAIVFALPYHMNHVEAYAESLDGLLVTGGDWDVDPALYTKDPVHPSVKIFLPRCHFEFALVKAMWQKKKPVLGICGGYQLMNVVRGGSLIQHIPDEVPDALEHSQSHDRHEPAHVVDIVPGTQLHCLTNQSQLQVNSVHHQAVKTLGEGLAVNCTTQDGLIEGFEDPNLPCFMGVQWHPEFIVNSGDAALLQYFVNSCQKA